MWMARQLRHVKTRPHLLEFKAPPLSFQTFLGSILYPTNVVVGEGRDCDRGYLDSLLDPAEEFDAILCKRRFAMRSIFRLFFTRHTVLAMVSQDVIPSSSRSHHGQTCALHRRILVNVEAMEHLLNVADNTDCLSSESD